jgi:peptidoglycan/xylan/chitin deacetylase (PgdA/CDA1 family)
MILRPALKTLVETGLAWGGIAVLRRTGLHKHALVLAYHNIVPDDCPPLGERSLHLPRGTFVRQLERLLRTHTIVPLPEVLTSPPPGRARPRVALTFDDAYRGAATIGVEELARRGLPATLFVVPAFVGRGSFWWDAVANAHGLGVDQVPRDRALEELGGKDAKVRDWAEAKGLRLSPVPDWGQVASEEELEAATRHPGITLASHTWSHPNLVPLAPGELQQELSRPLRWLRQRYADVIPWLSYPYGRANASVEAAAAAAGYSAALSLSGGWFRGDRVNRYAVPRHNIPRGLSATGFLLCTSGVCAHRP